MPVLFTELNKSYDHYIVCTINKNIDETFFQPETLKKRGFRALSVEVGDSPLLQTQGNGPIAMADSTRASRIGFSKRMPTLSSVGSSDEMFSLQEALKQGLAGTTHQLFTAKDDIDGMRRLVHIILFR